MISPCFRCLRGENGEMAVIYVNGKTKLPPRHDLDFYATSPGFAHAALNELPPAFAPLKILDPGAGTGVWGRAAKARWPDCRVTGVELRDTPCPPAYSFWSANTDYVAHDPPHRQYDLIVGNPPFKPAEAFVRKSMGLLREGGYCFFLFRLAFLEGQERFAGLWQDYPPKRVIVASRRINFTGNSNPNSYAMYLWQKAWHGETTLGWLLHEDNTAEEALPTAWGQLDFFDQC